jgi:hypothetical protein
VGSVTIAHLPDRDAADAMVRRDPLVVARLFASSRSTAGGSAAGPRSLRRPGSGGAGSCRSLTTVSRGQDEWVDVRSIAELDARPPLRLEHRNFERHGEGGRRAWRGRRPDGWP